MIPANYCFLDSALAGIIGFLIGCIFMGYVVDLFNAAPEDEE